MPPPSSDVFNIGAICFGLVIGWITYRTLRRADSTGISDIATVLAAVGGGAVLGIFERGTPSGGTRWALPPASSCISGSLSSWTATERRHGWVGPTATTPTRTDRSIGINLGPAFDNWQSRAAATSRRLFALRTKEKRPLGYLIGPSPSRGSRSTGLARRSGP